jgi:hypothetical protein
MQPFANNGIFPLFIRRSPPDIVLPAQSSIVKAGNGGNNTQGVSLFGSRTEFHTEETEALAYSLTRARDAAAAAESGAQQNPAPGRRLAAGRWPKTSYAANSESN